ncbi:MAG TPA: hypothetical protein DCY57_05465 [Bacteroidetes bacterium]|nr:hypothetical protein [Bacteroidota bacterium]
MRFEEVANFTRDNHTGENELLLKAMSPYLKDQRNILVVNSGNEDLAAFNSLFDRWALRLGAGSGLLSSFFDGQSSGGEMLFGAVAGLIAIGGSLFAIGQGLDLDGKRNYWLREPCSFWCVRSGLT